MSSIASGIATWIAVGLLALMGAGSSPSTSADANGGHQSTTGSLACNDGTVTWSPSTLWPPDHKMQTITITYTDSDKDGDVTSITVNKISDDQAAADGSDELTGSGQPTDQQGLDWNGAGNNAMATDPNGATTTVKVRAERSGTDPNGRHYDINVTCMDMGGSDSSAMQTIDLTVTVPHDRAAA